MAILSSAHPAQTERRREDPGLKKNKQKIVMKPFKNKVLITWYWNTNLSIIGSGTEKLEFQVESPRKRIYEQPQATAQVLSEE